MLRGRGGGGGLEGGRIGGGWIGGGGVGMGERVETFQFWSLDGGLCVGWHVSAFFWGKEAGFYEFMVHI